MTVIKKVLNQPNQQIGLVYTNSTPFYWYCNQPAGTVLEFRLVSKANVNVASSGYNMTVQSDAGALASSISVQSVASMVSLFSRTATSQATPTGTYGYPWATSTPVGGGSEMSRDTKEVSASVVVGVGIAGALLLITLLFILWWVYRRGNPKSTQEPAHPSDNIMSFMQNQPHQFVPPAGYVSAYTHSYQDPPQYPPPPEPTSTSSATNYSSTHASTGAFSGPVVTAGMPERDNRRGPVRNEKRRRPSGGVVRR
ncbi:hypothetical protein FS749_011456 [Ceratobasidium sp. UAMH 11750]|nr:hypothetical protein FS749_011456 [Ceratobasidium sp. UAMH 11750]